MLDAAVIAAIVCAAGVPDAPSTIPRIEMTIDLDGCPIDVCSDTCGTLEPLPDGTFVFNGSVEIDDAPPVRWSMRFDPDPFVVASIVATNTTPAPQVFAITVNLPAAMTGTVVAGGSLAGQLTDNDGDGATFAAPVGMPCFESLIDGVVFVPMLEAPFVLHASPFAVVPIGPASFGEPVPSLPAPTPQSTIGIRLEFELSPGDTANLTSIFVVEPVG